MSTELVNALKMVADGKKMSLEDLVATIEEAVTLAAVKRLGRTNLESRFVQERGEFELDEILTVTEEVSDPATEILLEDAIAIDPEAEDGHVVRRKVVMEGLGRIAAQSVRQMIHKRGREAETANLREGYQKRIGQMISAIVTRKTRDGVVFDLNDTEGLLAPTHQLAHDRYDRGKRFKVTIDGVSEERGAPMVNLSRTSHKLLTALIELETPEVAEGVVNIVACARDSSGASKVAVVSTRNDVDPVGAVIGARGSRIQPISRELSGEKIDLFRWSADPSALIASALTPAKKIKVIMNDKKEEADVIVDDEELSLAIGKRGVNVRLATQVTGYAIDVMNEKEHKEKIERLANLAKYNNAIRDKDKSDAKDEQDKTESNDAKSP